MLLRIFRQRLRYCFSSIIDSNLPQSLSSEVSIEPKNTDKKGELIVDDMKSWIQSHSKEQNRVEKYYKEEMMKEFDECLTSKLDRYKTVPVASPELKVWQALISLIAQRNARPPVKEEYRITFEPKQEMLYKETLYDGGKLNEVQPSTTEQLFIDYRPTVETFTATRSYKETAAKTKTMAIDSKLKYSQHPYPMATSIGTYTDNYFWLHNETDVEFKEMVEIEELYFELMNKTYEKLKSDIERQLNSYKPKLTTIPLPIGDYIYRRKTESLYDSLTISRKSTEAGTPEETIFSFEDIYKMYEKYGKDNDEVKRFVEQLVQKTEKSPQDLLFNFLVDIHDKYLAISFNMEDAKTLLIKDIKANMMLPIVIHRTTGAVAFEGDTIYFVEIDLYRRPGKLYQYSISTKQKKLIYEEADVNYSLSITPSKSGEYIFVEVGSDYFPYTNETWFKPAQSGHSFALYSPMRYGVSCSLQQAGDYFYVLTNENRPYHYLMKVKIPDELLYRHASEKSKVALFQDFTIPLVPMKLEKESIDKELSLEVEGKDSMQREVHDALKYRETPSNYFYGRSNNVKDHNKMLQAFTKEQKSLLIPPVLQKEVFDRSYNEKPVLDFSVFHHYIVTKAKDSIAPELIVKNLLKDTQHQIILPETSLEMNIEPSMKYDHNVVFLSTSHLSHPEIFYEYNMPLRKLSAHPLVTYENINTANYFDEKILVKARDGSDIAVRLVYHKRFFNKNSPAILFTQGSKTDISSFAFKPWIASALERGCTIAYPEIRGTQVSDYDWYSKGILKHKIGHFTDFGDVANFLKDQKIANKLTGFAEGASGSMTLATVMLKEPHLFEAVVLKVTFLVPIRMGYTIWLNI